MVYMWEKAGDEFYIIIQKMYSRHFGNFFFCNTKLRWVQINQQVGSLNTSIKLDRKKLRKFTYKIIYIATGSKIFILFFFFTKEIKLHYKLNTSIAWRLHYIGSIFRQFINCNII